MIEVLGSCLVHDLSANFRLQIREKLNTILYLRDLENLQGNFSIDLKVLVRKIKQEIQDAIAQLKDAGEQQISLKSTLEAGVDKVISKIEDVKDEVKEKIPNSTPCRKRYMEDAEAPFDKAISVVKKIETAIRSNDGKRISKAIENAINHNIVVKIRKRKALKCGSYTNKKEYWHNKTYKVKDYINSELRLKIEQLTKLLGDIKNIENVKFKAEDAHKKIEDMGLLDIDTEDFVGEIPTIKSISFETAFNESPTKVDATILVFYKNENQEFSIEDFDLLHPEKSIKKLSGIFTNTTV
ncbi:MAG: hypothetical protein AAF806_20850 [Bacteroidota bacterium]